MLTQQGRVGLDADWNEAVELVDRMLRVLAPAPAPAGPDWTDFNESDPGVALVELFTFLAESLLWKLDEPRRRRRRRRACLVVGAAGTTLVLWAWRRAKP